MLYKVLFKRIIKIVRSNNVLFFISKCTLYLILRLLFATYRLKVIQPPEFQNNSKDHYEGVFYFWHQHILSGMYFFYKKKQSGYCVISPSVDGKIAGFIAERLKFSVIYGSQHKAPIALLRQSLSVLKKTKRLCIVGDGSRGPAFRLQQGVIYLSEKSNLPLVFVECQASWSYTMKRSWDQFKIPLPFSLITIIVHPPQMMHCFRSVK